MALVNSVTFAALQGFSPAYVTKLLRRGIISRDSDGLIDQEEASAALAAHRTPAKQQSRRGRPLAKPVNAAGRSVTKLSQLMLQSRIKTEIERGKIAELERRKSESELVETKEVEKAAFARARIIRDALLNLPSRVSTMFAAETDPSVIHNALEQELRTILNQLSNESADGQNGNGGAVNAR